MSALGKLKRTVATATGALNDVANSVSHIELAAPASLPLLKSSLAKRLEQIRSGALAIEKPAIERWRAMLTVEEERLAWSRVVAKVGESPD
jgi:hypothetical protein